MKKLFVGVCGALLIGAGAYMNLQVSATSTQSDLTLANLEALAEDYYEFENGSETGLCISPFTVVCRESLGVQFMGHWSPDW